MCGIIGYVGNSSCKDILINSLKKLEYRGYDSCGISTIENKKINTIKSVGKISSLQEKLNNIIINSKIGIGHTRWATHGKATIENAHPHISNDQKISLVHNGIIENYLEIKQTLLDDNVSFYGKTDTEVIVKYIEKIYAHNPLNTIESLTSVLKGSYALAILFLDFPDKIFFIRKNSPLLIGLNKDYNLLSSDIYSISSISNEVIYLEDEQYGYISNNEIKIYKNKKLCNPIIKNIKNNLQNEKGLSSSSYLEKEIFEIPSVISNILKHYIKNGAIDFSSHHIFNKIKTFKHINIIGCGSSYNAGLIGKFLFKNLSKINCDVHIASESNFTLQPYYYDCLNILISQSGETADVLSSISLLKGFNLGIINVENSSLSFKTDDNFYLNAGTEVSVATTKAYIGQLTFLYLLSIEFAKINNQISLKQYTNLIEELKLIPIKIEQILNDHHGIKIFSKELNKYSNIFFIGRGLDYLTCIEGSLKLKEITYIHSEALPSGELKHGTISLIDENIYTIALLVTSKNKTLSNIEEIKARNGKIFTISNVNSDFNIPLTNELFYPLLEIIPLQLLALYTGINKNLDIDKPRNLAKSVTVE